MPSAMTRSTAVASECSMFARVVSKWLLLGMTLPGSADQLEEDAFARPALVGRQNVRHSGQVAEHRLEAIPASRPGVGLVAAHHAGPLLAAHGGGAAVGEQVDDHVLRRNLEEVEMDPFQDRFPLLGRGELDRFHHLDFERFDNRLHGNTPSTGKPCESRAIKRTTGPPASHGPKEVPPAGFEPATSGLEMAKGRLCVFSACRRLLLFSRFMRCFTLSNGNWYWYMILAWYCFRYCWPFGSSPPPCGSGEKNSR